MIRKKKQGQNSEHLYDEDVWKPDFRKETVFPLVDDALYSSRKMGKIYEFSLKRKGLFAWVEIQDKLYRNFSLDAELSFVYPERDSAVGVIFNYLNESNFLFFLVSAKGYFRFSAVINNTATQLINWTEVPDFDRQAFHIRILSHDYKYIFCLNEEWVGEIETDLIESGQIAFAAQNFYTHSSNAFSIQSLRINTKPWDLEQHFTRWNEYIPASAAQRKNLAETFFQQEQYDQCVLQLKHKFTTGSIEYDDYIMLAKSFIQLNMYEQALNAVHKALEQEHKNYEAHVLKANILYLMNQFQDLHNFVEEVIRLYPDDAVLWNHLGHAFYNSGNFKDAAAAYAEACKLSPELPILWENSANACHKVNMADKAAEHYLKAINIYFREGDFDTVQKIFNLLKNRKLSPDFLDSIEARIAFTKGDYTKAKERLSNLRQRQSQDDGAYYLAALLAIMDKDSSLAETYLQKAVKLNPEEGLYWFKLAELEFLENKEYSKSLQKAEVLCKEDPWLTELKGQIAYQQGNIEEALHHYEAILDELGEELPVLMNAAQLMLKKGQHHKAIELLERFPQNPIALNELALIQQDLGNISRAVELFQTALQFSTRKDPLLLENAAIAHMAAKDYNYAEYLFKQALELGENPHMFRHLAWLSQQKGHFHDAEAHYQRSIELEYTEACYLEYAQFLANKGEHEKAKHLLSNARNSKKIEELLAALHKRFEKDIHCAQCYRQWTVPKKCLPQSALKIHGQPPEHAPAGACPSCGKIYCISCALDSMDNNRFLCKDCGEFLKLASDELRYLLKQIMRFDA